MRANWIKARGATRHEHGELRRVAKREGSNPLRLAADGFKRTFLQPRHVPLGFERLTTSPSCREGFHVKQRIVPIVLAVALFMENMDSTVIATSLATIARDIGTSPIALKLALTSYFVSLAIFIPISGRMADRFGAKEVFRLAIVVFMAGSIACAFAGSLHAFVFARFLQGMGGAMMTPVGRLLLVRAVPKGDLVSAMAWFTIPALIGPLVGPPIGGAIATYADWRWIFLINIPIGIAGIALSTRFLPHVERIADITFDWTGFALSGLACAGIVFGFSVVSLPALPPVFGAIMVLVGAIFAVLYVGHARRATRPVIDLAMLGIPTLRAAVIGGAVFRIGAGAVPFLFPLMLQLGFHFTPLQSGLVSAASVGGAMGMKFLARPILRRFGFRSTLLGAGVVGGMFTALIGVYRPEIFMPFLIVFLLAGGFFRSLFFTSINTLAFADVPKQKASDATALLAAFQQVAIATGVATAGAILEAGMVMQGTEVPTLGTFTTAFLIVGGISALASAPFLLLPHEAGAEVAGHRVAAAATERRVPAE
ncbi:MFS transporter [Aureimonas leprariae]|uniref:MFS transporter n=1 Tax=Plantimonas leprariae TaxID=2615207 RepID=UPI0024841BA3|nr:MFS transporter [Aureimonas leprariae]